MRLAIISDIHANLVALDVVLSDIDKNCVDRLVCLGDVAELGPQPHEVIQRLRKLKGLMIMGNEDEALLHAGKNRVYHNEADAKIHDIDRWALSRLTDEDIDYVRRFDRTLVFPIHGCVKKILLCHGSPRSSNERITSTTPSDDELLHMVSEFGRSLVVVSGHTHVQMLRKIKDSLTFLNPGSVGMPFNNGSSEDGTKMTYRYAPGAEYAIVTVEENGNMSTEFRCIPIDLGMLESSIRSSKMPHAEWFISHWMS